MIRKIRVSPWRETDVGRFNYHVFVAAAGYEQRATFISERMLSALARRIAFGFDDRQVYSFEKNRSWYQSNGFEYLELTDDNFEGVIGSILAEIAAENVPAGAPGPIRVGIDISSLSRVRLAAIVSQLVQMRTHRAVSVDFFYAIAQFSSPSTAPEPIPTVSPVLPFFAGWSPRLDLPTVAVVGLGYEPDKAVGAYEYLEATRVWAFVPSGEDAKYDREVHRANVSLLTRLPPSQVISYRVDRPFAALAALESVAFGAKRVGRAVLLPFGPKMFALSCLLVGCIHRDVAVWRISAGKYGQAVDRLACGKVVGLNVAFEADRDEDPTDRQFDSPQP